MRYTIRMCVRALALPGLAILLGAAVVSAQLPEQGPKEVARGSEVMVSALHPESTKAMLEVLEQGGNAVDAAIVGTLAETVLLPHLTTIAGGVGGLVYSSEAGELTYLDGELNFIADDPPIGRSLDVTSGLRIGVPGMLRGLEALAERYGTMSWEAYVEPAVRFAERGFPMYSFLYGEMWPAVDRLTAFPSGRETWTPEGVQPLVGEIFRQPRLAETLRKIGEEGPDYMYAGEWAHRFVEEVNATGGRVSLEDLRSYRAHWREPLRSTYRGHEIVTPPPASNAGVMIGMILNILEELDLEGRPDYMDSPETLVLVRQAFDLAIRDMTRFVSDPAAYRHPTEVLLSKEYGSLLASLIDGSRPTIDLSPRVASTDDAPREESREENTSHIVVVDADGNWVSLTHTVYGSTFGTGLVVDGVGVNTGNTFPGVGVGEARRVVTPFPATMVVNDDGAPWLALGSPGFSSRAVAMVLINMLGFGMDLESAIVAPRFQGFAPGEVLEAESRIPEEVLEGLARYGVETRIAGTYHWKFGSIQAVMRDAATGELIGATDPRRSGYAEGH